MPANTRLNIYKNQIKAHPEYMELKQLNILLADDDIDDCIFFKKALTELPMPTQLTTVHDGEELMQMLINETTQLPHVIFLDINMPRKNGFECLADIKKNDRLKDVPVIMFSTSNSRDAMSTLFKTGADIYIRKPRNFEQLKELIHHALPMATEKVFSDSQLKYILNA
jgi:CheY-like chemotaxis protein